MAQYARGYGYHDGDVATLVPVARIDRRAHDRASEVTPQRIAALAGGNPRLVVENLSAGYGKMKVLRGLNLRVGRAQSLCLIGPNGAGKSTVLHSIFGFTTIYDGTIRIDEGTGQRDITGLGPSQKLKRAGIAYILQDKSVFEDMTVEENLWMGGYLLESPAEARRRAEEVLRRYERLAARRSQPARVLSGGERRLLEISRALVMEPEILLVDEPSIGLEPRYIDMVFEILTDLQKKHGKTIVIVEQNAKRGLEFADIGYVLVSGEVVMAGPGRELAADPQVGELFLGA